MNRRSFLQWAGAVPLCGVVNGAHAVSESAIEIVAKPGKVNIVGPDFPATEVWGFNG